MLNESQMKAIEYVRKHALARHANAISTINSILEMSNVALETFNETMSIISSCANVAIHFHPDRIAFGGNTVAESLLESGEYKNQFETAISNGKVSISRGGSRDRWENQLFGNAFSRTVEGENFGIQRPKYGALNLLNLPDGPCPRFGSCYFILNPRVSHRCTFTYRDSYRNPIEKGTIDTLHDILSAVLTDSFEFDYALGIRNIRPKELIELINLKLTEPINAPYMNNPFRNLDYYIEAQIHGIINLEKDVSILVIDPSFKNTPTGDVLLNMCKKYQINQYWHSGYEIRESEVPSDFRGARMPSLAKRIASNNRVNARIIGEAVTDLIEKPKKWSDRGTKEEILQELKLLWHVVVKYGEPLHN